MTVAEEMTKKVDFMKTSVSREVDKSFFECSYFHLYIIVLWNCIPIKDDDNSNIM